jgi:uncharacterized protein (TIGR02246 family)
VDDDERAIRELVATWLRATVGGDVAAILPLMDDDVVFLTYGHPPMRGRAAFEQGFRHLLAHYRIHSTGEIREIEISGDWAYCWSYLSVGIEPLGEGKAHWREGDALSILRKGRDGAWKIARDANMLSTVD